MYLIATFEHDPVVSSICNHPETTPCTKCTCLCTRMQSICVLFLLLYTVLSSAEVNNLLVPSGVITTIADQSEEASEVEDCLNGKRDRPLPPATCSIVQQCPQPQPPTSSAQTSTLSSFGIEPGVCLKNVAAIITQQQHHQTVITSAAPNPTKELPSEVIAGTKEKPDFHFDKHSQFTGIFYFFFPPPQCIKSK